MNKEKTFKVYCLQWSGNSRIPDTGANYTDKERAKKHCEHANKHRNWAARLIDHRWTLRTLVVKEGPKQLKGKP